MAKVSLSMNRAFFHCPGCDETHCFRIRAPKNHPNEPVWSFNGDVDKPSFSPSLLKVGEERCHLFVCDGKIIFLADCHHKLAGQTVGMEDEK